MIPVELLPPVDQEVTTQQRVIDNVTITIGPQTTLKAQDPQDDGTCRFQIGEGGFGSALIWFTPSVLPRLIEVLVRASMMKSGEESNGD